MKVRIQGDYVIEAETIEEVEKLWRELGYSSLRILQDDVFEEDEFEGFWTANNVYVVQPPKEDFKRLLNVLYSKVERM